MQDVDTAAPVVPQGEWSQQDYQDQADFRRAIREFVRFAEEQARVSGITPQQHVLLAVVRGHPSYPRVGIGEVADALQVRQSSASLLVDRGVRRGLINRREDTVDRRRAVICLTEHGQRILDQIMDANRRELGALRETLFRDSFLSAIRSLPD